jgi:hypothetical protein
MKVLIRTYLSLFFIIFSITACGGGDNQQGRQGADAEMTFSATTVVGSGGSASPAIAEVQPGEKTVFTITPGEGFIINKVLGCNGTLEGNIYTTGNLTDDCQINASFSRLPGNFTVLVTADAGGSISEGSVSVLQGETTSFTIAADTGFIINQVSGCNGVLNGNTYITGSVVSNCTVNVNFSLISVANQSPVANAGSNQTVTINNNVSLSGLASQDPDGDNLTYNWIITSSPAGSTASLSSASSVNTNLIPDLAGNYDIQLIVNDGSVNSVSSTVSITANSLANQVPVANAGSNQTVTINNNVSLSGLASQDPDGDSLTYSWSITSSPAGSSVSLTSVSSVNASLIPDLAGNYDIQLMVNDGLVNSAPDSVTITANTPANQVPVANAGTDQIVQANSGIVILDGNSSSDPEGGALTYQWAQTSGKPVQLLESNLVSASFYPSNVADVVSFSLIVTDEINQDSVQDSVSITLTEPAIIPVVDKGSYLDITGYESSIREMAYDSNGNIVFVGTITLPGQQKSAYPGLAANNYRVIGQNALSTDDANANNNNGDGNVIVSKVSADLSTLIWRTVIGGSGKDRGYGLRLDSNDNVYIAGRTSSSDFPTTSGAFDETYNGGVLPVSHHHGPSDAFAIKLSADGSTLLYSTYLGGSNEDMARGGLAIDTQGNAYICGSTYSASSSGFLSNPSSDLQNLNPVNFINPAPGGFSDGFIIKLSSDGSQVVFNKLFGSSNDTIGEELAVSCEIDLQGQIHAVGMVWGNNAPTTADAYQRTFAGVADVYYLKLSNDASSMLYATHFGGSGGDFAEHGRLFNLSETEIVFSGETESNNITMTPTAESTLDPLYKANFTGGSTDGFLVKLNITTGQPVFSTYIGGFGHETVFSALQPNGSIIATGRTGSPNNFGTTASSHQVLYGGGSEDAWIREYSPEGVVLYSSYFGGGGNIDYGRFIIPSPEGGALIAVKTSSPNLISSMQAVNTSKSTNGLNGEDNLLVTFD